MGNGGIRIGTVSTVDAETGMVSVIYEDRNGEVTDLLPYATFNDEYKPPKPGEKVIVLHLSNGGVAGVVFGTYWNESHTVGKPGEYRKNLGGDAYLGYDKGLLSIAAEHIKFIATDDGEDFTVAELMRDIRKIKSALGITS